MEPDLQHKLQQFSTQPPEGVWQKVADALDREESLGQRLFRYEESQPPSAWQKIEKRLGEAAPAKEVSFVTRFRRPLRYAAVACFLAVVFVTIKPNVKQTGSGGQAQEKELTSQANSSGAGSLSKAPEPLTQSSGAAAKNTTAAPNPATANRPDVAKTGKETTATSTASNRRKGDKVGTVYASLNEYVFFSDGDGRTRKVSKKLADLVNCKDNNLTCKQRLKELRQRMATSAMTTDFTGVLELLRQLQ